MLIDLTPEEIDTILTSLRFSRERVAESPWNTKENKEETLSRIQSVSIKLCEARKETE